MPNETKDIVVLKENLQTVMKHLLDLLREILASIHEERIIVGRDEMSQMQDVLMRRQELLKVFDECYVDFVTFFKILTNDLPNGFSLNQALEWLQLHLDAEDVELLLLGEQLIRVAQEMQIETKTLISVAEHKSAFGPSLSAFFIKLPSKSARIAVGLIDQEETDRF